MANSQLRFQNCDRRSDLHRALTAAFVTFAALIVSTSVSAATFAVNSTDDDDDNDLTDGICWTGENLVLFNPLRLEPECTLRASLSQANQDSTLDTVEFSGSLAEDSGFVEIRPATRLPFIIQPIFIDGYSHPDYVANTAAPVPIINLNGELITSELANGFEFGPGSGGSTVRGMAIVQFRNSGIRLRADSGATGPANVTVQGNHIGVSRGDMYIGNGRDGIEISFSLGTVIGTRCLPLGGCSGLGNVISGNLESGIDLTNNTNNSMIAGNLIGVDRFGTSSVGSDSEPTGNGRWGIHIGTESNGAMIGGVGSTIIVPFPFTEIAEVASGNTISANGEGGILVSAASDVEIFANRIGTDLAGSLALPNAGPGILVEDATNLEIGIERTNRHFNVISGNAGSGVEFSDRFGSDGTSIRFNRIGVNASGTLPLGNGASGIATDNQAPEILIDGNIIGGNAGDGIFLDPRSEDNFGRIESNFIGTNATGDDLGNTGNGISVESNGVIGARDGRSNGRGNVIGWNEGHGIFVMGGADIRGNFIGTNAAGADIGNAESGIRYVGALGADDSAGSVGADETVAAANVNRDGNSIAFNGGNGVAALLLRRLAVRGNEFWNNDSIAIDLVNIVATGVTLNDPDDADESPIPIAPEFNVNRFMNNPEFSLPFTFYNEIDGILRIGYRVDTALENAEYPLTVDFYFYDPWRKPGDEVSEYLGSDSYPAENAQSFRFAAITPRPGTMEPNDLGFVFGGLRAIVTDAVGNSSELSVQNVPVPEPSGGLLIGAAVLIGTASRAGGVKRESDFFTSGAR